MSNITEGKTVKQVDIRWRDFLGNLVDAPELFNAYPEFTDIFKGVWYEFGDMRNILSVASYNTETNTIRINRAFVENEPNEWRENGVVFDKDDRDIIVNALTHEIQHAIQQQEGFAIGGSSMDSNYNKLAGEVEARNAQTRLDMTEEERKNTTLAETEDVDREEQIVRYSIVDAKKNLLDASHLTLLEKM